MKLYFSPGACSLAPHIVLREAGFKFEVEQVDLAAKKTKSGKDYLSISPLGYVPALQLESGEVLTEAAVIMQYLADKAPQANMAPARGTMEHYHFLELLNFVSTELHKGIGLLWNKALPAGTREVVMPKISARLDHLEQRLAGHDFLTGSAFTAADAYCFTVLGWTKPLNIPLDKWTNIQGYMGRVRNRPAVQAAMETEGLLKKAA